jgi:hypothetical protein
MLQAMNKFILIIIVLQISSAHWMINASPRPLPRESVSRRSSPPPPRVLPKNYAGCDAIIESCGPNGGCCDVHDKCFEINKCTASSWIPGVEGLACWKCNWDVMKCIAMQNPGMSSCCSYGTCGIDETILEVEAQGR